MDSNLDKIAKDLYGKITTRFPNVKIGDENAEVLSKKADVPRARFFEFEYETDGVPLGNVTITLDEDDGVVVQMSGTLAKKKHPGMLQFIRGLRKFARTRLLNFDVQDMGKDNLSKRDYQFQAKPKELPVMTPALTQVMESKFYGTARISYQDLGEARLVVKHSQPVNTDLAAGRTMHIESIYVENAQGERFKYPFKHLDGARALAEHLKHGGNPYDSIGKHITSLSEELASLRKFKGYVSRQEQLSEAMENVTSRVLERIDQIKETVRKLQKSAYYESFVESYEEQEEEMIPEEVQNDLIDRLTIRTFNEDLKAVFPFIYKFVKENELPVLSVNPDDLLDEMFGDKETGTTHKGGKVTKTPHGLKHEKTDYDDGQKDWERKEPKNRWHKDEILDPEDDIDESAPEGWEGTVKAMKKHKEIDNPWALAHYMKNKGYTSHKKEDIEIERLINAIVEDEEAQQGKNNLFSKNVEVRSQALEQLKDLLGPGLQAGPGGMNAIASLKGIIDSEHLTNELQGLDGDDDAGVAIKIYLKNVANGDLSEPTEPGAQEIAQEIIAGNALNDTETGEPPVGGEVAPELPPAAPAPAPMEPAPAPDMSIPPAAGTAEPAPDMSIPPAAGTAGMAPAAPMPMAESRAKLIKAIHRAKDAGATLETTIDFGHKEMTLHDALKECGVDPMSIGFKVAQEPAGESGVTEMLKSIAGFWNPKNRNFTIGGTRAKIKVLKSFKNGEYANASEDDLKNVLKMINNMDPSEQSHELGHIKHLAGVQRDPAEIELETITRDMSL